MIFKDSSGWFFGNTRDMGSTHMVFWDKFKRGLRSVMTPRSTRFFISPYQGWSRSDGTWASVHFRKADMYLLRRSGSRWRLMWSLGLEQVHLNILLTCPLQLSLPPVRTGVFLPHSVKDLACTRKKYLLADPVKELFSEFIFKAFICLLTAAGWAESSSEARLCSWFQHFFKYESW